MSKKRKKTLSIEQAFSRATMDVLTELLKIRGVVDQIASSIKRIEKRGKTGAPIKRRKKTARR